MVYNYNRGSLRGLSYLCISMRQHFPKFVLWTTNITQGANKRGEWGCHCHGYLGNISYYNLPLRDSQFIIMLRVLKSPAPKKEKISSVLISAWFNPGALWTIHE